MIFWSDRMEGKCGLEEFMGLLLVVGGVVLVSCCADICEIDWPGHCTWFPHMAGGECWLLE